MLSYYIKLFAQKKSRYISWNILFLWGFGLWIALCMSNIYNSDILIQKATLFYQQNCNSGIAHNIATETETMENVLHITTNCTLCNTMLILKAMLKYIYVLVFVSCIILFVSMREHIKKSIKIWNTTIHTVYSTAMYLKNIARNYTNYIFDKMITNKSNLCNVQSELIANYKINTEHLQKKFHYDEENKNSILKINNVQNKIIFSYYTMLLFNNYELYYYFYNQQIKNTSNLLTQYSKTEDSEYIENDLVSFNNNRKNNNLRLKKGIQKRIISSSPEFQKFLANSKKFRLFYPHTLKVFTSYVIYIKSTYE